MRPYDALSWLAGDAWFRHGGRTVSEARVLRGHPRLADDGVDTVSSVTGWRRGAYGLPGRRSGRARPRTAEGPRGTTRFPRGAWPALSYGAKGARPLPATVGAVGSGRARSAALP